MKKYEDRPQTLYPQAHRRDKALAPATNVHAEVALLVLSLHLRIASGTGAFYSNTRYEVQLELGEAPFASQSRDITVLARKQLDVPATRSKLFA